MKSGSALPKFLIALAIIIIIGTVGAIYVIDRMQAKKLNERKENSYGIFLDVDAKDTKKLDNFKTVVIDPQKFTSEDIALLKEAGKKVYGYLNIGSIDNRCSYYDNYKHLAIGDRENRPDEQWVDVTDYVWQDYVAALVLDYAARGLDGFFVDGCDLYYYCLEGEGKDKLESGAVREALVIMLKSMRHEGKKVMVNGGDTLVNYCLKNEDKITDILTAVNEETVITAVDYETNTFGISKEGSYFKTYLDKCADAGLKVFAVEYATDTTIIKKIEEYYEEKGYSYYISNSLEFINKK